MAQPLKVLELFAGIGACTKALERLGVPHEVVDVVEIDRFAVASYNAIHGTSFQPQDITGWDKELDVDLIMHGSPCQDFSIAGLGRGGDRGSGTRSSLLYETLRIAAKLRPRYVIWENVKNVLSAKHRHNFDQYLEEMNRLGYVNSYEVLNAKDYGVPQNRQRVFVVSELLGNPTLPTYQFPSKVELAKKLRDVLETDVADKYYLSDEQTAKLKLRDGLMEQKGNGFRHYPPANKDVANTLLASDFVYLQCIQVGDLNHYNYDKMNRVFSADGTAPTLDTMTGGNREPKIIDDTYANRPARVFNHFPTLRSERAGLKVMEVQAVASRGRYQGGKTKQQLEVRKDGLTNTLTTVQKDNYVTDKVRIRKLTPKECWRLMGFDDEDFEKAAKVNSNSQLYKQAGNSIVVNVLEAILSELLSDKIKTEKEETNGTNQARN